MSPASPRILAQGRRSEGARKPPREPSWRHALSALVLVAYAIAPARSSAVDPTEPITMIVNRDARGAEIYMTLAAQDISPLLGSAAELLFSENASVPVSVFRQQGSFEVADALISRLELRVDGIAARREAMSLMVHPASEPQPYQTPWDAILASSVCSAEDTDNPLTVDTTRIYFGIYSLGLGIDDSFALDFPQTTRSLRHVVLREFFEGRFVRETNHALRDGGQIPVGSLLTSDLGQVLPILRTLGACAVLALGLGGMGWGLSHMTKRRKQVS